MSLKKLFEHRGGNRLMIEFYLSKRVNLVPKMKTNTLICTLTRALTLLSLSGFSTSMCMAQAPVPATTKPFALAVHGGAGVISRKTITPEVEAQYRAALERALLAGYAVLNRGGTSTDAVVAVIKVFEDDPLFNAGKGAVFSSDGKNELDAAIMDGKTGLAGAVAGVTTIKNPITAARAVMDKTKHVMLIGKGAEQFAVDQHLDMVDPSYFYTEYRWQQLQRAKEKNRIELDHNGKVPQAQESTVPFWQTDYKHGTVGAVALDQNGNLAAGTSTGGLTNKLYGRVGDSPIIGAGTFADNATAAFSGTGTGEFYMRAVLAHDIAARMKYAHQPLAAAVDDVIQTALTDKGGTGGVIGIDAKGNIKFGFNTEGMYRGYIKNDGKPVVAIFKEE